MPEGKLPELKPPTFCLPDCPDMLYECPPPGDGCSEGEAPVDECGCKTGCPPTTCPHDRQSPPKREFEPPTTVSDPFSSSSVPPPPPPLYPINTFPLAPFPPALPDVPVGAASETFTISLEVKGSDGCQKVKNNKPLVAAQLGVSNSQLTVECPSARRRRLQTSDDVTAVTITVATTPEQYASVYNTATSTFSDAEQATTILGVPVFPGATFSSSSGAQKDPHLAFAHGGRADFKGLDGRYYNFFSAPGFSVNVKTEARREKRREKEGELALKAPDAPLPLRRLPPSSFTAPSSSSTAPSSPRYTSSPGNSPRPPWPTPPSLPAS